jgi:Peptidase family S41/Tricorn protease C1 domain
MKHYTIIIISFLFFITGCSDFLVNEPSSNLNINDFNSAWQIANKYYPFFKFKRINWDSLYAKYKPQAEAAKGDEIYNVLYQMFSDLKDGHIEIITEGGFPVITYDWPRDIDRKAFSSNVVSSYFTSPLKLAGENKYDYGITPNNVGYVYISTFSEGDNLWYKDFDKIMGYFRTAKGIIIDVRNNGGGNSNTVDYMIARLIEKPVTETWYRYFGINRVIINPANPTGFNKPVAVLINGASFSAAESFPELLRQSSNATLIGDTTGGGGGTNDIYTLPSGKRLRIANGYFTRLDGTMVEWNGVLPDILIKQTEADITSGHDIQLEYAINFLDK